MPGKAAGVKGLLHSERWTDLVVVVLSQSSNLVPSPCHLADPTPLPSCNRTADDAHALQPQRVHAGKHHSLGLEAWSLCALAGAGRRRLRCVDLRAAGALHG